MATESLNLRTRILEEATRLFMNNGYNGISMREIAAAVGVSKAGLYYHFKDKEDLFLAILYESLNAMEIIVRTARGASTSVRGQIDALVRTLFAQPAEQRAIMRLAGQELAHLGAEVRATFGIRYQEQFIGQIAAMLRDGTARGELRPIEPQTLTWLLLGMLYPFFTAGHAREPGAQDQTIEDLLTLFFDGAAATQ